MNPQDSIRRALLEDLAIESLPPEAQQEAIAAAGGPLLQSVMLDVLAKIPQAQQGSFQQALEAGDQAAIEKLIAENIPDATAFIEQSVERAVAEFKSLRG